MKFIDPETTIKTIKEKGIKTIILYCLKIIYNLNKNDINIFLFDETKTKYNLKLYNEFYNFNNLNDEDKIDYGIRTLKKEEYEKGYKIIEKNKNDLFSEKISKDEFKIDIFGIDNFYVISKALVLSNLKRYDYEKSEIYSNFYKNICIPLFDTEKKLAKAIQLFYDPNSYLVLRKKYGINSNNIEPIFYGYRYCLNELFNLRAKNDGEGIYYPLYDKKYVVKFL
jgi:hypothetical protein